MNAAKNILLSDHLRILYFSLIHPYLSYGNILWGNSLKKYTNSLVIKQKRAIRTIANVTQNTHSSQFFKQFNILKFHDLHYVQLMSFMYDFIHNNLPKSLENTFEYHTESHVHNTRHKCDPVLPKLNCRLSRNSLLYECPNHWIKLNHDLKSSNNKRIFKHKLQHNIISLY